MLVIAKDGEEIIAKRELPDELGVPPHILVNGYCADCGLYHLVLFEHFGMHDDGEIFIPAKEAINE